MVDLDRADDKLTASECAARTGLTIRALRIYERYDLISPSRAASGWRQYGQRDLVRLNTICVLKTAGLTLTQIRAVLHESEPSLQKILHSQVENWRQKKDEAEQGRRTAEAALQQLRTDSVLSVDQLCELIRSNQMSGISLPICEVMRRILALPAEERRAWADRHNEEISPKSSQEFQEAVRTLIDPELERLKDAGAPPSAPEVQSLIVQHLVLMQKYRAREAAIEWLTSAGPKGKTRSNDIMPRLRETISKQVLPRLKQRPTESSDVISSQWTSNPFLVGYFSEAERQSVQCKALDAILLETKHALQFDTKPSSRKAQRLAEKYCAVCSSHSLGDPLIYARWAALVRPPALNITETEDTMIWEFIADSVTAVDSASH